jgi:serine/threonine protein kinase
MNYQKIRLFNFLSWHHGVGYATALNSEGLKVFIKTSGFYSAAQREFEALSALSYFPYFPKVYIFKKTLFCEFVVMEFIEGDSINNTPPTEDKFKEFCYDVIKDLNVKNIIHRDIRPDNIFIKKDGSLILIDFGWAIVNGNSYGDAKHSQSLKTLGDEFQFENYAWNDGYSLSCLYKIMFNGEIELDSKTFRFVI